MMAGPTVIIHTTLSTNFHFSLCRNDYFVVLVKIIQFGIQNKFSGTEKNYPIKFHVQSG